MNDDRMALAVYLDFENPSQQAPILNGQQLNDKDLKSSMYIPIDRQRSSPTIEYLQELSPDLIIIDALSSIFAQPALPDVDAFYRATFSWLREIATAGATV